MISVSVSVLRQRRLQIHRQDRRPNPDFRSVPHPIPHSSGRVSLSLYSERPFDLISLFLLFLEPSILLSRRPSQRPQRRPNPTRLQLSSRLPRTGLPVHLRVRRFPLKPLFEIQAVPLDLLFFRKGRMPQIIQEQKFATYDSAPFAPKSTSRLGLPRLIGRTYGR